MTAGLGNDTGSPGSGGAGPRPGDPGRPAPGVPPMSRGAADAAAVGWGSFLAACLGAFIGFAVIDPSRLGEASDVIDEIGPMTGYGLGFLFLWLVSATAGGLTWLLIRTSRGGGSSSSSGPGRRARAAQEAAPTPGPHSTGHHDEAAGHAATPRGPEDARLQPAGGDDAGAGEVR